jgi:hypothetical protein
LCARFAILNDSAVRAVADGMWLELAWRDLRHIESI